MTNLVDIGLRIELVSMYPYFHDISISLYERQVEEGGFEFQVHSYAGLEGVEKTLDHVISAMVVLGGMSRVGDPEGKTVRFGCGSRHRKACRRVFLEACKITLGADLSPIAPSILDKKTERNIIVESLGNGGYRVSADGKDDGRDRRISAIAGGFVKLAEMDYMDASEDAIVFDCNSDHTPLVGLLLKRALNVRAVIREDDLARRGMLAAPSAQQQ